MISSHPAPRPAPSLGGLWVPIITPFDGAGDVDRAALGRLGRRLLADGATGLVALGTTGEPAGLDDAERQAVIDECAIASAAMGRPLLVGVGTNSTRTTVAALGRLDGIPAVVAALVVVPYYTRPSPDAVVEHLRVAAAESPVPVVAYHVPVRTGRSLTAADLLRIAALDHVIGMKQSVGALDGDTLTVLRDAPAGFQLLAGDDAYIVPTVLMGGAGAIAAAAHVCTPMFVAMVDAALAGDVARSRRLAEALGPVIEAGFAEPNPAGWKALLHRGGEIATPDLRAPMGAAGPVATDRLAAAVADADSSFADEHDRVG